MIKKILLRIAYMINKHYNTIEIKYKDFIKYEDTYYGISSTLLAREIGCVDTLTIELRDISSWLNLRK